MRDFDRADRGTPNRIDGAAYLIYTATAYSSVTKGAPARMPAFFLMDGWSKKRYFNLYGV